MNEEEQSLVPKPSNFRRGIGNAISGGYITNLEEANSAQAKQLQDARATAEEQAKKIEEQTQEIQTLKAAEKPIEQREAKIAELEKRLAQLQKEIADAERARDEEYASKDGKMDPKDIEIEEKAQSDPATIAFFDDKLIQMREKLDTRVKELKIAAKQGVISKEELDTETRRAFEIFEAGTLGCLSAFLNMTTITTTKDLYLKKIQERMQELTSPGHDSDKKHIDSVEITFAEEYLDTKYEKYRTLSSDSRELLVYYSAKGEFDGSKIARAASVYLSKTREFAGADVPTMTTKLMQEEEKAKKEHLDRDEDL